MNALRDRAVWIDTHCHLDAGAFAADRDAVIEAARAVGVGQVVIPAVERGNFAAVRGCAGRYRGCQPAYGIHPMYTGLALDGDLDELRRWLADEAPIAVGEIGLDGFVPGLDWERQQAFFVAQLKLARDFDLPVLLHIRRAQDAVLKELRRYRPRGGIAHAFNGSRQQAEQFIALGFKLGIGGAMTYTRATRIRELAATLPLEALVLETDAPDIAPAFAADRRNVPATLPRIAAELAALRQIDIDLLAARTTRNARDVLPGLADPAP